MHHLPYHVLLQDFLRDATVLQLGWRRQDVEHLSTFQCAQIVVVDESPDDSEPDATDTAAEPANPDATRPARVIAPLESLPFPENSFDVILAFEALNRHHALPEVLAELRRILSPYGFILLSAPARSPNESALLTGRNEDEFVLSPRDLYAALTGSFPNVLTLHQMPYFGFLLREDTQVHQSVSSAEISRDLMRGQTEPARYIAYLASDLEIILEEGRLVQLPFHFLSDRILQGFRLVREELDRRRERMRAQDEHIARLTRKLSIAERHNQRLREELDDLREKLEALYEEGVKKREQLGTPTSMEPLRKLRSILDAIDPNLLEVTDGGGRQIPFIGGGPSSVMSALEARMLSRGLRGDDIEADLRALEASPSSDEPDAFNHDDWILGTAEGPFHLPDPLPTSADLHARIRDLEARLAECMARNEQRTDPRAEPRTEQRPAAPGETPEQSDVFRPLDHSTALPEHGSAVGTSPPLGSVPDLLHPSRPPEVIGGPDPASLSLIAALEIDKGALEERIRELETLRRKEHEARSGDRASAASDEGASEDGHMDIDEEAKDDRASQEVDLLEATIRDLKATLASREAQVEALESTVRSLTEQAEEDSEASADERKDTQTETTPSDGYDDAPTQVPEPGSLRAPSDAVHAREGSEERNEDTQETLHFSPEEGGREDEVEVLREQIESLKDELHRRDDMLTSLRAKAARVDALETRVNALESALREQEAAADQALESSRMADAQRRDLQALLKERDAEVAQLKEEVQRAWKRSLTATASSENDLAKAAPATSSAEPEPELDLNERIAMLEKELNARRILVARLQKELDLKSTHNRSLQSIVGKQREDLNKIKAKIREAIEYIGRLHSANQQKDQELEALRRRIGSGSSSADEGSE